ncbi:hypothetical protein EVAR_97845_1 [Eumeta japonica]|uniref:Uncharacterized protein n=1 Tax=Eumeta variegata TaxID=151549 RepID=A0A4C1WZX2_EUMVA|nr:hypothetical protein EVAR_97845_1 [Eumeta japonica]
MDTGCPLIGPPRHALWSEARPQSRLCAMAKYRNIRLGYLFVSLGSGQWVRNTRTPQTEEARRQPPPPPTHRTPPTSPPQPAARTMRLIHQLGVRVEIRRGPPVPRRPPLFLGLATPLTKDFCT